MNKRLHLEDEREPIDGILHDEEQDDNKNEPTESGGFYNEEMSRAAVGRLFDDDKKGSGEPVSYVSGFDKNDKSDKNTTRRRKVSERSEDFDNSGDSGPDKRRNTSPRKMERTSDVEERPRSRRATTRIMEEDGDIDFFEAGFRDARTPRDRDPRESSDRHDKRDRGDRRGRPQNPDPRPAVRVNVERPEPRTRRDNRNAPPPIEDEFDNFRQRYNPDELISSPRSPGKTSRRPAPERGGRGSYIAPPEFEAINPIRWVAAGSSIVGLVLLVVMVFRMTSLSGQLYDANETIYYLQNAPAPANMSELERDSFRDQINDRNSEIMRLTRILQQAGIDPNQPDPPEGFEPGGIGPGQADSEAPGTDAEPEAPSPGFPMQVTVARGDSLSRIATRYYGSSSSEIIQLIATHNNLANINEIQEGQSLTLPPLP